MVRLPRDDWYNVNKGFTELLTDLKVIAISLYGSSEPGEFAIMEHAVSFKLAHDPPPQAVDNLPPGAKKGDPVGMINISVLWWDANGNVTREFEYGRLTWKDFDVRQWDQAK